MAPCTLYQKIWRDHVVEERADGSCLLYIDRHMAHEVTSPQAFSALRESGRRVRRPGASLAVADHGVPTRGDRTRPLEDEGARAQVEALEANCAEAGIRYVPLADARQGIVHVVGPEQGFTQPGMTIVCGDSHTSTHGAVGALAFGIGTSEVEHVLATQTLPQRRPRSLRIRFVGEPGPDVGAKDYVLAAIGRLGVDGGVGHVIEYAGPAIERLTMEG